MKKRILSILLSMCMLFCLMPTTAFAAQGDLYLGGVNVIENPNGSGPNGGSYSYDSKTSVLTLTNYVVEGEKYHIFDGGQDFPTAAYLYTTLGSLEIKLVGNCKLGGESNLKDYMNDTKSTRIVGIASVASTSYIYIENSDSKNPGSLTVNTHIWPVSLCHLNISCGSASFNSSMHGSYIVGNLFVNNSNVTMASKLDGKFTFAGAKIKNNLNVGRNAKLTVTTNGVAYTKNGITSTPDALQVEGTARIYSGGMLVAKSEGSNSGDGCQGRAMVVSTLNVQSGGRVEAYSSGYSNKNKKYDGREAIYVGSEFLVDTTSSVYAKNLNPDFDNSDFSKYSAIRLSRNAKWNLQNINNDKLVNNLAVVTSPSGGYYSNTDHTVMESGGATAKEVEVRGIRKSVLALGKNGTDKTWCYRASDASSAATKGFNYYDTLKLDEGYKSIYSSIGAADYQGFYGIDVQSGTHTVVIGKVSQSRENTYITVRSGATLNLQIGERQRLSYSGSGNVPIINVESGGTLNIGGASDKASLSLLGGNCAINASNGAKVNFKNCTVYTKGSTVGGDGSSVSFEDCWADIFAIGNLSVTASTLKGKFANGTLTVDRISNVALTDIGGNSPTNVKDFNGTKVYKTTLKLENINSASNANKSPLMYLNSDDNAELIVLPIVTGLRIKEGGVPYSFKNLKMFTGGNSSDEITVWLPENTTVENVYGYDDGSATAVGYIYEAKTGSIVTKADNNSGGTMALRNLLLAKGILALKGTAQNDDTKLCGDYQGNKSDTWIDYEPSKEIKLQADKTVTGFGIRVLEKSNADVKLNSLHLIGENKRVTVDNSANLTLELFDDNSMTADGNDAVLNISGSLTINGVEGSKKLKLGGKRAIADSTTGSLTIKNSTIVSECTDKTTPTKLKSLTVSNSNIINLGVIDCADIKIDGGNVDLDVPDGTIVKNSKGNILSKQVFTFDGEINSELKDIKIDGMPEGSSFDVSNTFTDGNGKLSLWLPAGVTVTQLTVGSTVYYPKSGGSTNLGEVPIFTAPTEDEYLIKRNYDYITFTVSATGTPTPRLQWQKSVDGGNTWVNIDGETGSSYSIDMSGSLNNTKYRCVASNNFQNNEHHAVSKVFTLYNKPTPYIGNGVVFYVNEGSDTVLPLRLTDSDSLGGIDIEYKWQVSTDKGNTWSALENETADICTVRNISISHENRRYKCDVTLTYPNGQKITDSAFCILKVVQTPIIENEPSDKTVKLGEKATFSVTASVNYDIRYQWQVCTDGTNWADITGATDSSYTTPTITADMDGWQYRCVVENSSGRVSNFKTTDSAVLNIAYTVRFDTNGGTSVGDKTDVRRNDKVLDGVSNPTKNGWQFTQWKCNGISVTKDTTFADLAQDLTVSEITLTAQWVDNIAPVISGIESNKTYCLPQTVTVGDENLSGVYVNGKLVDLDENGSFVLDGNGEKQTVSVYDKAGNLTEITVTVNGKHTGGKADCKNKAICAVCGEIYGEVDLTNHPNLKHINAKAATKDAAGNIEYWYCPDCDRYFADKNATKEIAKANTVTAKLQNKQMTSPQTGNNTDSTLWFILLFVGSGTLTVTVFDRKKKKHNG